MTIDQRPSGSAIVLDVDGRMTIETVNDRPLTVKVRRLLQEGQRQILLNLTSVPYLDTTGLCDIVEAYVAARRQGGCLKLLHLTAHVRAVLATTRLLTILEAYRFRIGRDRELWPVGVATLEHLGTHMTAPEAKDELERQTTRAQTALAGGRSRASVLRSERTVLSSTRHASIIAWHHPGWSYSGFTFSALGPFGPCPTVNDTRCPSRNSSKLVATQPD